MTVRVTPVVALTFCLKNLVVGTYERCFLLEIKYSSICGGDIIPLLILEKKIEPFARSSGGDAKTLSRSSCTHTSEPSGETFTI